MNPAPRAAVGARLLRAAVFAAVCAVLSAVGHAVGSCAGVPGWAVAAGFLALFAAVAPLAGRPRSTPGTVMALAAGQLGLHVVFGLAQQRTTVSSTGSGTGGGDVIVQTAATLVCGGGPGLTHAQALHILTRAGVHPADVLAASGGGTGTGVGAGAASGTGLGNGAGSDVLTSLTGMPGMQEMPGMHDMAGMVNMPGMLGMPGMSGMSSTSGLAALLPTLPMVLGHLLAALATGWLLRRGDLALSRIVQLSAQSTQGLGEVRETLTDAARLRALRAAVTLVRHLLAGLPGALRAAPCRPPAGDIPATPTTVTLHHTVIRRGPPAALALAA